MVCTLYVHSWLAHALAAGHVLAHCTIATCCRGCGMTVSLPADRRAHAQQQGFHWFLADLLQEQPPAYQQLDMMCCFTLREKQHICIQQPAASSLHRT